MDELERLREQVGALQREVVRLRNPSQRLWSRRDVVWNQIEETLGLGTWTWDVAAQAVDWSPGLYRILGFDPEVTPVSEAAKVFDEHIHPEDLEAYLEGQERALGGDTSTPSRFRFRRPDGEVIHCLLLYTAVKDAAGEALSFAGAILDVTERVAAEREMVRKGRLEVIGRLAGSVAHDFNNLLMVVLGNAELLQLEQGESEGLGQIQAAAKAGSSLTRQLLSFSATRQGSAPVTGSLRRLVDDAIPMIKRLLREDISVFVEHESGDDLVRVDPGQLQASVVNLAVNARDAMPRGGKLSFRTRTERLPLPEQGVAECVVLSVIDSGVGMSSETLELIFEPFFTTKPPSQGTGLGLASVKAFMEKAGGDLRVHSAPQAGTTFDLVFPLAEQASPAALSDSLLAAIPAGAPEVLVVEDSPGILRVLRLSLQRAGVVVHAFARGADAISAWEELADRVQVLVTDVVMPDMSGHELAKTLRERRPDLGVVFVSGFDPSGLTLERSTFLGKPFTLSQLLEALKSVSPVQAGS